MTDTAQQLLFVLGMHRSGTSAMNGVLTLLGAPMPATPMADQQENAKGFFESIPVMEVNDAMLLAGGSSWDDWSHFTLSPAQAEPFRAQLLDVLRQEFGDAPFVALKDPRICRLFPWWVDAAREGGYSPHVIVPYRNPLEVAESLHVRNGLSIAEGILLWLRYVLDAEYASRGTSRAFVTMAQLLEDWRGCIQEIAKKLDIVWPIDPADVAEDIDNFLDKGMRHSRHAADALITHPLLIGWAAAAYGGLEALRRGDTAANRRALDKVRDDLNRASQLMAAAAVAAISRQRVRAEQVQGELDTALQRLHAAEAPSSAEHARLKTELASQRRASTIARKAAAKAEARRAHEFDTFTRSVADLRDEAAAAQAQLVVQIENLQRDFFDETRRQAAGRLELQARISALQASLDESEQRLRQYREAGAGDFLGWAIGRNTRP